MAWTYHSTLLTSTSSTDADMMRVRFLVGDVTTSTQLVQDEEINWTLTQFPNVWECGSVVAKSIATHFAKLASQKSAGSLSLSWSERSDHFTALSKSLKSQAASASVRALTPYSGGISKSDKQTQLDDTDWDKPSFARGMHDIPGSGADWITDWKYSDT